MYSRVSHPCVCLKLVRLLESFGIAVHFGFAFLLYIWGFLVCVDLCVDTAASTGELKFAAENETLVYT